MNLKIALASATAIGLLMASGAAYAGGSSAYLNQSGHGQLATINQDGGSSETVGNVLGNPFFQTDGTGSTGNNKLLINQNTRTGSELANIASLVALGGAGNTTTGFQKGSNNLAEIDQGGNSSSVNLEETGAHNGWIGSGPEGASGDPFTNSKWGNLIVQDSSADGSSIDVKQTSDINAAKANFFNIGQGGGSNHIGVTGTLTGGSGSLTRNDVWIRQGSVGSDLWGWTYGNPFALTSGSLGPLTNSTITVTQSSGYTADGANYTAIGQGSGNLDIVSVIQAGIGNAADVNQIGSNNTFQSNQTGSSASDYNFVGGEAGWPDSNQNPLTFTGSNPGDYRPILQSGNFNEYYATQNGTNLYAFGSQLGDSNFLNSTQSGDRNSLYSLQNGNDNAIYSDQSDDQNTTIVSQSSGNYSNTTQSGTGNNAYVTQ